MKVFQFLLWFIFSNIWFTKKSYRTFCWEKNLEYSKITKIIYQQKNQNNVIVIMTPPPTNKTETTNAGIIFYLHTTNSTSNLWKKEMFKSEFYSTVNLKRRTLCLNNKWNTSSFTVVCTTVAAHCSTHIHSRSDLSGFLTGCAGWQLKQQKWASLFENPKNKKRIKKKIFPLMDFSLSKI